MKTVAIMQPYFIPYAGYFRLFAAADEVIMLDDVQFPRRGFVHRNSLRRQDGSRDWLTLPLIRAALSTEIRMLAFPDRAYDEMRRRVHRFRPPGSGGHGTEILLEALPGMDQRRPVDFIIGLLDACCQILGLPGPSIRSSELGLPPGLRGQDRIVAIARMRGASTYLNPPGGTHLYDAASFAEEGLALSFLPPFEGCRDSVCERLDRTPPSRLLREILAFRGPRASRVSVPHR